MCSISAVSHKRAKDTGLVIKIAFFFLHKNPPSPNTERGRPHQFGCARPMSCSYAGELKEEQRNTTRVLIQNKAREFYLEGVIIIIQ